MIWLVVDLFMKMAHSIPCKGFPNARETAQMFVDHIFNLHGLLWWIVSDQGTQFNAQFWKALMEVELCLSSTCHRATNDEAEKMNTTVLSPGWQLAW